MVKNLTANAGDVREVGWIPIRKNPWRSILHFTPDPTGSHGDPQDPQYSILAWKIPWTEETGRPQSVSCKESDTTEAI